MNRLDKIKQDIHSIEYGYDSDLPMFDDLCYCLAQLDKHADMINLLKRVVSSFLFDPTHIHYDIQNIYTWLKKNDFYTPASDPLNQEK